MMAELVGGEELWDFIGDILVMLRAMKQIQCCKQCYASVPCCGGTSTVMFTDTQLGGL